MSRTSATTLTTTTELTGRARTALHACGAIGYDDTGECTFAARSPITGEDLFTVVGSSEPQVREAINSAKDAFPAWRDTPAPVRGALIKRFGELLTEHKHHLADLVTIEVGKIGSEALGEVQEMIDICDLAVGMSRQLEGRTLASERPGHKLVETWHPLGVVGVITAFNFPCAPWAWNTAVALVCGDTVVWKPSQLTSLTALASSALLDRAIADVEAPAGIHQLVLAGSVEAAPLLDSPDVPLVSATGSERLGREIAPRIAERFGRAILELGGNNAAIVAPSADLDLATRGITFSAAGTAGQRCTTMRRAIVHEDIVDELVARLTKTYSSLNIGDPFSTETLVGPLINEGAYVAMCDALEQAVSEGGEVVAGGRRCLTDEAAGSYYVEPAIVRMPAQTAVVEQETFAPILYVLTYRTFEQAVTLHNAVPQGLSSSIFTTDQREAERFTASAGSDCGIANVNIGTSGAEIGGAFGGEKTTGGGRESGSDAWRGYMRRATNTINYSTDLPLAQGVNFA
ncbi:L-piperidine-6-carboxylate dehydrogenase [Parasphingorhabdus pacifica]